MRPPSYGLVEVLYILNFSIIVCLTLTNLSVSNPADHDQATKQTTTNKHDALRNYASAECAKVVGTNPEATKASYMINGNIDDYMLNPCKTQMWFVIELCETIQATHIEIANHELFSSKFKDFSVYFSDVYPASDWKLVGQFTATDARTLQSFNLNQVGFGKFIRVELHSHYGKEHYCPISEVKVYGVSMVDEYENSENSGKLGNVNEAKVKPQRRASALRVFKNMILHPNSCGLVRSPDKAEREPQSQNGKEQPNLITPPTNQQVVSNRTSPLKSSIFVELSNKVKALENSLNALKTQNQAIERRINDTESNFSTLATQFRSFGQMIAIFVIAFLVYKMMLDLM